MAATFIPVYNICYIGLIHDYKKMKNSQCFPSLHLGGRGGSAKKDQWFTFFIDIELWTQSLTV